MTKKQKRCWLTDIERFLIQQGSKYCEPGYVIWSLSNLRWELCVSDDYVSLGLLRDGCNYEFIEEEPYFEFEPLIFVNNKVINAKRIVQQIRAKLTTFYKQRMNRIIKKSKADLKKLCGYTLA